MTEIHDGVFVLQDRNVFVYLVRDGDEGLLIDAGFAETARMLLPRLAALGVRRLSRVLLTHGHGDHYEGAPEVVRAVSAEVCIHPADAALVAENGDYPLMRDLSVRYPGLFSVPAKHEPLGLRLRPIAEGDRIAVGSRSLRVLHTPGHSAGSSCFLDEERGLLFSGDAVSGDFVHFYCEPATLDSSLARLERERFDHLLMAHPYPPENANALAGARARGFLAHSRDAVSRARARVAERRRAEPAVTAQALAEEMKGTTLISIIRMIEAA